MVEFDASATLGRRTAHEFVRDALRNAILRGSIKGGTHLVQTDIARELQVSTTPVREALRDLAAQGVVKLDAHRGAIVKQFDYNELVEIHELARLLEPEAMRRLANEDHHNYLEPADSLATQMESEPDAWRWVDLNRTFHKGLIEPLKNRRMFEVLTSLYDTTTPYVGVALEQYDYRREAANRHHRALIEALRNHDGKRAAKIAVEHVDLTIQQLEHAKELFDQS